MSTTTTFAAVQSRYARLDAAGQAWVKQVSVEAEAAGVGISAKHTKSVRRFGILVALVQLAADEIADDDVRKLLSLVIGDVALFAGVPLGHLVGSLNATEADTFAGLATGRLGATFDASGRPVVTEVAA